MEIDTVIMSVHYQEVDPGLRWVKDAAIAIDSDGPLDSDRALTPNVIGSSVEFVGELWLG